MPTTIDEELTKPDPAEIEAALRERRFKRAPWFIVGMILAPTILFYFTTHGNPPITSLFYSALLLALGLWLVGLFITLLQVGYKRTKSHFKPEQNLSQAIQIVSPTQPIWYQAIINGCWVEVFVFIPIILDALGLP